MRPNAYVCLHSGWVWQDAYVIKKSMKKYFLKKNIVKIRKKNWSNFKPQKLVQKLHDIEIKNNICIFFHFEVALTSEVNMASRGLHSEPENVILKGQERGDLWWVGF